MFSTNYNLRRLMLLLQVGLFIMMEKFIPSSFKFFSSYGTVTSSIHYALWVIPLFLLAATFLSERFRPLFFLIGTFVLLQNLILSIAILVFFILFHFLVGKNRNSRILTGFWILLLMSATFSSIYYLNTAGIFGWFWLLMHVSWALKLIAWTVTVRLYDEKYNFRQCVEFFFNPVFFFFTNDLNVLTPKRFFSARDLPDNFDADHFKVILSQTVLGMFFLCLYGLLQQFYFLNLGALGILGLPFIGSVISIFTAILFHGANALIQVSMLNAYSYKLLVDMDQPWLAATPAEYWKRMHFYVRDYIFEIVTKPILTNVIRLNVKLVHFRIVILTVVYLIFTCTQVGYQPYRQGRTLLIGFLVTGVFVAMMALPELILNKRAQKYLEKNRWLGRLMTFMILYVGYYFIFASRKGF